ncbi:hypothetical protein AU195_06575 [Mycobacterium sp. IS-1496]|nr:hypothetical protein AU195_06575 [Mycobacterium sp. IS-1496]
METAMELLQGSPARYLRCCMGVVGTAETVGYRKIDPTTVRRTTDRVSVFANAALVRMLKSDLCCGIYVEASAASTIDRQTANS